MEKRFFGIILTTLGIVGLVWAGVSFLKGGSGMQTVKIILFTGILGIVFFIAGIGLIRNTKDKPT